MPLPLSGFQINANQAFAIDIVAGPMPAVVIGGGRFDRQVNEPEILVDGDLSPHAGVAVLSPRPVFPRLVSRLARSGHRIKPPELFAGSHIERAHQAFSVVMSRDRG